MNDGKHFVELSIEELDAAKTALRLTLTGYEDLRKKGHPLTIGDQMVIYQMELLFEKLQDVGRNGGVQ